MKIPFSPAILILIFIIILVSIPTGALLIKQRIDAQNQPSTPYNGPVTAGHEVPKVSPILDLGASSSGSLSSDNGGQISYGPMLQFSISMEGRPASQEQGKIFVGIGSGTLTTNPQYLLSYSVDVPTSGITGNVSLVGLSSGQTYTAYIKGPAQIAKAVSFVMTPTGAVLNSNKPINLTTGDLNQDNKIDQSDYQIATAALGTTPKSSNWNPNIDFNLDNIVNIYDLSIISKNLGQVGDGGPWYSQIDQSASESGKLNQTPSNIGGPNENTPPYQPTQNGYWMWVPGNN